MWRSDVFASVFRSKSRLSAMTIPQPRARGHGLPSRSSCRNLRRVCKASPVRSQDIINQRPTTKQLTGHPNKTTKQQKDVFPTG